MRRWLTEPRWHRTTRGKSAARLDGGGSVADQGGVKVAKTVRRKGQSSLREVLSARVV